MRSAVKKLFGGIELTWPKLIIWAVISGAFTAAMAIIPAFSATSFIAITVTFEVWILFGIIIIMNSKSNIDSALKCFVFFLISQPLVYLIQVPFSHMGWNLFGYYKYWFIWTLLCLPMGYIGYYMKKGKWWGYLILFPMIVLTGYSYASYLPDFMFYKPKFILICIFCICAMILYPVLIFENKKIRTAGALIGAAMVLGLTFIALRNPPVYSTEIMGSNAEHRFDDTYEVSLADEQYGDVQIVYYENLESYMIHADFTKAGRTVMTIVAPDGSKQEYDLVIERTTYEITQKQAD
ncbi:MAG: hypothetical protein K5637_00640 [Lachnospiraceae bacterium]|nr:hypothetical protein [Lachnospiraceae bacterium]